MATTIWVHSGNDIVTDALVAFIGALGYDAHATPERPSDLAVWSICGLTNPTPLPPPLPTLALLCPNRTEDHHLIEVLRLGYRGFLRPTDPSKELPRALEAIHRGEVWAPRNLISYALGPSNLPQLTPKEVQVLNLVRLGMSNKEVAQRLGNAEGTIKAHVTSILEKLSAKRRTDLLLNPSSNPPPEE